MINPEVPHLLLGCYISHVTVETTRAGEKLILKIQNNREMGFSDEAEIHLYPDPMVRGYLTTEIHDWVMGRL